MKDKSTILDGQWKTTCREERERERERVDTDLGFSSTFHLLILKCASGLKLFEYLHMLVFTLVPLLLRVRQLTLKPVSSAYFCLAPERKPYPFPMVPHLCRRFVTSGFFFLVLFNYCSHYHLTGWPTTSVLVWVTHRLAGLFRRLCICFFFLWFFLLSPLPLKLASRSSHNLDLLYHIYPTPPLGQDMTQGQFLNGV